MVTQKSSYLPWLMWLIPLFFFSFQFILRLWPSLMMPQIMQQFSIDASQFGLVAAFYYYGYASMQIPVALLLERYGTRLVLCGFAVLCGLATIVFTLSNHWYLACLSRFFIGAGSAVGFLSVSKIIATWFPKEHYTKMVGLSFTVGLLGAVYGGKPINLLIETYSWKNVALVLGLISTLIGSSAYLILKSNKQSHTINDTAFKLNHFREILSSPIIWLLAFANLLMVGALEGFSDVWGIPYLMASYAIDKSEAAQLISFIFLGMLGGGPLLALCSKKMGHYAVIALCGLGMATAFFILLLSKNYHPWGLTILFAAIGILCCYQVIVFAAGAELVQSKQLGVTIAFLNCINMLGGSFFHTLIGQIMERFWAQEFTTEGIRQYSLEAYRWALLLIPVCACLGAVIIGIVGFKIKQNSEKIISPAQAI